MCQDLDTKTRPNPALNLSGFLETLDQALPHMKNPKDTLYLDNKGQWKVFNEDQPQPDSNLLSERKSGAPHLLQS
jgi:hypothetical protein